MQLRRGLRGTGGQTLSGRGGGSVPRLRRGSQDPGERNRRFTRARKGRGGERSQTAGDRPAPQTVGAAAAWEAGKLHGARVRFILSV